MARQSPIDLLVATRISALTTALPAALGGEPAAVHKARVASRRLREVLPTLALHLTAAADARKPVRRVTRALGPVRELDVTTAMFASLVAAGNVLPLARLTVEHTLARRRATALRDMQRALTPRQQLRLTAALDDLAGAAQGSAVTAMAAAVTTRVAHRAHDVGEALTRLGVLYDPERLHDVRIAVKQLRYALEVAGDLRLARAVTPLRSLRAAQELLGRAHDLHVLAELLRGVEGRLVSRSRRAARDLRRLSGAVEAECRQLHAAFLGRRGRLAALVTALARTPDQAGRRTAA